MPPNLRSSELQNAIQKITIIKFQVSSKSAIKTA